MVTEFYPTLPPICCHLDMFRKKNSIYFLNNSRRLQASICYVKITLLWEPIFMKTQWNLRNLSLCTKWENIDPNAVLLISSVRLDNIYSGKKLHLSSKRPTAHYDHACVLLTATRSRIRACLNGQSRAILCSVCLSTSYKLPLFVKS